MFFKAIAQYRPDLVILAGVHLLEAQVTHSLEQTKSTASFIRLINSCQFSHNKSDWRSFG